MTPLDDLIGGPPIQTESTALRARVLRPPATAADGMTVGLDDFTNALEYEIPVKQRIGPVPGPGDVCLVMFDDNGDAWGICGPELDEVPAGGAVGDVLTRAAPDVVEWAAPSSAPSAPVIPVLNKLWLPAGVVAETYPRQWAGTTGAPASGTLRMMALTVPAGSQIRRAMLVSSTAATAPTHQWVCLVRPSDLAVLTKSNSKTTEAWGANTAKTFDGLSYDVGATDEALYLGYVIVASGMPNVPLMAGNVGLNGVAPIPSATSSTGLTDPASLGATAGALTAAAGLTWGAVMTA